MQMRFASGAMLRSAMFRRALLPAALVASVGFTNRVPSTEPAPIAGRVMDLVGDAVQFAHVRITDQMTGAVLTTLTSLNGNFVIENLSRDHHYSVDVRCIGYVPRTLTDVQPTADGAAIADVMMEPIPRRATPRIASL